MLPGVAEVILVPPAGRDPPADFTGRGGAGGQDRGLLAVIGAAHHLPQRESVPLRHVEADGAFGDRVGVFNTIRSVKVTAVNASVSSGG